MRVAALARAASVTQDLARAQQLSATYSSMLRAEFHELRTPLTGMRGYLEIALFHAAVARHETPAVYLDIRVRRSAGNHRRRPDRLARPESGGEVSMSRT